MSRAAGFAFRFLTILLAAPFCAALHAGNGGDYGPLPPIGSNDVAMADPLVARPAGTPCEVVLFDDFVFDDYSPRDFDYAPPADCAGPWAKIVLSFDLSVTAGIQYDRTATLWIGGVNVFFGTTAEPSPTRAPSWHVERDLTDYAALLADAQPARAFIGNIVNSQYTGVIHGSAKLEFYAASASAPAPVVPDRVVPLGSDPVGATVDLSSATDLLSATPALPANVERAYLDVVAESQGSDEFWWSCMPDDVAAITGDCPGTAFREVEIGIDGEPAGVAPVYPWVYTGGLQPLLWMPIAGVQTLNFKPYRVDLTPFAGVLSNGAPHTLTLGVFNAHEHFSTTATLLLYLDAGTDQITGAVTTNTIGAGPTPTVSGGVDGDGFGSVTVDSQRHFTLAGYVETSHGRVDTSIEQTFAFTAVSGYAEATAPVIDWTVSLATAVDTATTVTADASTRVTQEHVAFPFSLVLPFNGSSGSIVSADLDQRYEHATDVSVDGAAEFHAQASNHVATHHESAVAARHSEQQYDYSDSTGACYSRDITSVANALASVTDGAACVAADTIFVDGFDGE
ncbi:MAG TPA: peptide-N4-asparagine amidase [Dokdonella sp.]